MFKTYLPAYLVSMVSVLYELQHIFYMLRPTVLTISNTLLKIFLKFLFIYVVSASVHCLNVDTLTQLTVA